MSTILTKHLTNLGQMWLKYLSLATFAYNTFNTPNLANFSQYELVFRRKPKVLLNLNATPDIKVSGTFKDSHELLNRRLKYLHELLQNFKLKSLAMINKNRDFLSTQQQRFSIYNISINKSITHSFKESNDEICRSHCSIYNYRPT